MINSLLYEDKMSRYNRGDTSTRRRTKSGIDTSAQIVQRVRWQMSNSPTFDYEIMDSLTNTHIEWAKANVKARKAFATASKMKNAYYKELRRLIILYNSVEKTSNEAREAAYKICQRIKWLTEKGVAPIDDNHGFRQAYVRF